MIVQMKTKTKTKGRLTAKTRQRLAVEASLKKPRASLYWAYGANLNHAAMKARCPGARPLNKLSLPNGRLTFRGVADCEIVDDVESLIQGGVWRITETDEAALDRYEGFPRLYVKRYLKVRVSTGSPELMMFYAMNLRDGQEVYQGPPYGGYYEGIVQGYKDFGLDEAYLTEALERAWDRKNWSAEMLRRWEAKGSPSLTRMTIDDMDLRDEDEGEEDDE
jgi:hypothetical protein